MHGTGYGGRAAAWGLRCARMLLLAALAWTAVAHAQGASSTALSSSAASTTYGQALTLTATVTGSSPEGTVTFMDGGTAIGTATLSSGVAALTTSSLPVGSHTLTAAYAGDANNAASTSSALAVSVGKAPTTTSKATSSPNPTTYGSPVTFTVTVTGQSPTGTVNISNPGYYLIGTAPLTGTGNTRTATLTINTLGVRDHTIGVDYSGDANNNASTDGGYPLPVHRVTQASSTTTLTTTANPSVYGAPLSITATVDGALGATGNVSFWDGTAYLGMVGLGNGTATISPVLSGGTHNLKANYEGSANHLISSSATIAQVITQVAPTVALTTSSNPSVASQGVTLTATVASSSATGNVTFYDGTTALGTRALSGGTASLVTSSLAAGSHSLTAVYTGDANNAGATSAAYTQQVSQAASSTTLTASSATAAQGENVTLVAKVTGFQPSGVVTFSDGGTTIGTASITGGSASLSLNNLGLGAHAITAAYAGDGNNYGSTSSAVTVTIGARASNVWQYGYDAMGRPNTVIDPNGQPTYFYYDSLGRRIQTQQPANTGSSTPTVTEFGYDSADSLTSVTDPRSLATTYSRDGLGQTKTQSSPDSGNSTYTYDAKGNVLTSTDARGKTTTYTYDALDRVSSITYATGTPTVFEYDGGSTPTPGGIGELTRMTDESGQTTFSHDAVGRITSKTMLIGSRTFKIAYGWGDAGTALDKLTSITYPSGTRVNYLYDDKGSVAAITVNPVDPATGAPGAGTVDVLSQVTYNADARVSGWQWSGGLQRSIAYDGVGYVSGYTLGDPGGTGSRTGALRTLQRDAAGRITGYVDKNTAGVALPEQGFAYDKLDRLVAATIGSASFQYSYDASGNRTASSVGGVAYAHTIDAGSNKLLQVQDATGTATVSHDAAGNVLADGLATYSYSDRGRMATASGGNASFAYNGLGQRALKIASGIGTPPRASYYVYDEAGQLLGEYDANGAPRYETIYLGSTPVALLKQTGSSQAGDFAVHLYNVYADQIDTPRMITAQDHTIVWRWDQAEPFGATAPDQNPTGAGVFVYNQRFPGQVFDAETGLFQNWHREYRAGWGRYIQSDPIGLAGGINTFSYVGSAPLSAVDPTGLAPGDACPRWREIFGWCKPTELPRELCDKACSELVRQCKRAMGPQCLLAGTPCTYPCDKMGEECRAQKKIKCNQDEPAPNDGRDEVSSSSSNFCPQ